MKIDNLDKLHKALQKDDYELEASKIMQDLYMRWFAFGLGVGFVVACLFITTLNVIKRFI